MFEGTEIFGEVTSCTIQRNTTGVIAHSVGDPSIPSLGSPWRFKLQRNTIQLQEEIPGAVPAGPGVGLDMRVSLNGRIFTDPGTGEPGFIIDSNTIRDNTHKGAWLRMDNTEPPTVPGSLVASGQALDPIFWNNRIYRNGTAGTIDGDGVRIEKLTGPNAFPTSLSPLFVFDTIYDNFAFGVNNLNGGDPSVQPQIWDMIAWLNNTTGASPVGPDLQGFRFPGLGPGPPNGVVRYSNFCGPPWGAGLCNMIATPSPTSDNCLSIDPAFLGAGGGNFELMATSPCIDRARCDAGGNPSPTLDALQRDRSQDLPPTNPPGEECDMGALERQP